jgi:predicted glycosyltransferase
MLKVLVAPLDWGLGHATRCIPIIKELINQKCQVIVAAEGAQKALLHEEFPFLTFVELPGYRVQYGKNRALTFLRLTASIPKILIRIKRENRWLRRFADRERPDLIVSDNRYGLYLPGTTTIFITHQLSIRTPFGKVADGLLQRINYSAISRFSVCWVPDMDGADGLAGELSHPKRMPPVSTRYIGWLSRMGIMPAPSTKDFDVLVLLSGPEPQRTILEKMIIEQASNYECKMVLVRGLPGGAKRSLAAPRRVVIYDHVAAGELERLMLRSDVVLSRPGYSTVMDLRRIGKNAIFVPTPGQTEQEYLGGYLAGKGMGICVQQHEFSLKAALAQVRAARTQVRPAAETLLLREAVKDVLKMVWKADGSVR